MYDPANLTDLRGDGLDGDGHAEGREAFAEDMLGFSPFKKLKKAVKKVASLPSRITKPIARVVSKVPVIGRPAASGLRAAAQFANPLSVLRPKSFIKTQARAITSPLAAARALVKKPAARKPPIAQRARPSWAKPLPAKPVARPAPRLVARAAPKPVARPAPRPVVRAAPKPVARPAPRPVVRPLPVARVAPRATAVAPVAARSTPSWAPSPSRLPTPTVPDEALEPMLQEEQPFEEQAPEEQPFEEQAPEEQPFEEEAPEEQPFEEEAPEEQPFEEEAPEEAPAGWEEET